MSEEKQRRDDRPKSLGHKLLSAGQPCSLPLAAGMPQSIKQSYFGETVHWTVSRLGARAKRGSALGANCALCATRAASGDLNILKHESLHHENREAHHHHTHASTSQHIGGHHLLQVEHLSVSFSMYDENDTRFFRASKRPVSAISDLCVSVHAGEIVAVVGASGSGKSLLADSILGLFEPNATVTGTIWFDGEKLDATRLAQLRGHGISYVPQSVNNLDPLMKVGRFVRGQASSAEGKTRRKRLQRELFARYDLPPEVEEKYPFELSGGMARRVLLACALVEEPKLIVADEPTPGLDLELAVRALDDLRTFADEGGGVLLITHDIELALRVADRIAVFKDGTVVEETAVENFASPDTLAHPYTRALWHALPEHDFTGGFSESESETSTAAATSATGGAVC